MYPEAGNQRLQNVVTMTTTIVDTTTANDVPASALTSKLRAPRRYLGHIPTPTDRGPTVRHETLDGQPCMYVELAGRHGQGREMLLSEEDAARALAITPWWTVGSDTSGNLFIGSGKSNLHTPTGQAPTSSPFTVLARVLAGAGKGRVVWFANGDTFDLRAANLEVISRSEASSRSAALRRTVH